MASTIQLVDIVGGFYGRHGVAPGATVAVAFSGGADSVALLAATRAAGHPCVALHCNFHLRGDESNRDERFACDMAKRLGAGIKVVHFDVGSRCAATGESVEMACRELRYDWFEKEFRSAGGAWACVAVAHHANDNIETFFLNLLRGAGLKGLCGIPPVRGIFMRPLLEVTRDAILGYLHAQGLGYVVDSSNLTNDYRRNFLRNEVLPAIASQFPSPEQSVATAMGNIARDRELLDAFLDDAAGRFVGDDGSINLCAIAKERCPETLLFHLLNRKCSGAAFGLPAAVAMLRSQSNSGLVFKADNGKGGYLLNRGTLLPFRSDEMEAAFKGGGAGSDETFMLPSDITESGEHLIAAPIELRVEVTGREAFAPSRNPSELWLDADAVAMSISGGCPLALRRWHEGDRFEPFGMHGSRLVSDMFSDAKLSLLDKRSMWLLVCGDQILWLPSLRASRHFPVTASTRRVMHITC